MRARDFRDRAWNSLDGKWGKLALISLLIALISGGVSRLVSLPFSLIPNGAVKASATGVSSVAVLLIEGPFALAWATIALKVLHGSEVDLSEMFLGFKNFGRSFSLMLLNGIFIFLWSLLFFIPGIVKAYAYSMSFYILSENPNMGPQEARLRSIEMMKGNKWRLFCLDCSFIGWGLLCILTFGVLSLWVTPYIQCAHAAFYEEIKREQSILNGNVSAQPSAEPAPAEDVTEDVKTEKTYDDDND